MLDVETNLALAAEILGVRYIQDPEEVRQESPPPVGQEQDSFLPEVDFFGNIDNDWL